MTSSDNNNCQSNEYFQQLMLIKKEYTKIKYIKSLYKSSIICNITLGVILLIIFILSDSRLCNIDTIDKINNTQDIDNIVRKYIIELNDNIRNIETRFNINIDNIKSEINENDVKHYIGEIDKIKLKQYNEYNKLYKQIEGVNTRVGQNAFGLWCMIICIIYYLAYRLLYC